MKMPQSPPRAGKHGTEWLTLLREHPHLARAEQDGRYLHWDELRHRPIADGITHSAWWSAIGFARRQIGRRLPLKDANERQFWFSMTDTAQRLVHEVDRDASGKIELPEDVTNQSTRDRYIVNSLIEEAITSSQLEGASTTRAVAKEMIRTQRAPRTQSERMILNNFHAMEWVRENQQKPLSKDLVFELHAIVTQGALEVADGAGRFRRVDEDVRVIDATDGEVVHTPPPAETLAPRMTALCKFANGTSRDEPFIHPVVRAILVHLWLAYDHPFVDGNGRTARALFYWSMMNQGYWLTEFISISRVIKKARGQYDRAFVFCETDDNDATYFVLHGLKILRTAIDDLHTYLRKKVQEVRDVEKMIKGRDDLNSRQLALLSHALRNPGARFTIEGHQTSHRVVYQTARTDLLGLASAGLLEQTKIGKKLVFSPMTDLERRLKTNK